MGGTALVLVVGRGDVFAEGRTTRRWGGGGRRPSLAALVLSRRAGGSLSLRVALGGLLLRRRCSSAGTVLLGAGDGVRIVCACTLLGGGFVDGAEFTIFLAPLWRHGYSVSTAVTRAPDNSSCNSGLREDASL